jgi:hypothetical protein
VYSSVCFFLLLLFVFEFLYPIFIYISPLFSPSSLRSSILVFILFHYFVFHLSLLLSHVSMLQMSTQMLVQTVLQTLRLFTRLKCITVINGSCGKLVPDVFASVKCLKEIQSHFRLSVRESELTNRAAVLYTLQSRITRFSRHVTDSRDLTSWSHA